MSITSPIRPLYQAQTYRDLLFLAAAMPVAALALGFMVAGWTSIAVLAITPLVVPVLLGYRGAVGLLARTDAKLARSLLGADTVPPAASAGSGFWGRAKAVFLDPNFWRQQGYLLLRMTVGFALAVGELSLIAGALGGSPSRSGTAGPTITSARGTSTRSAEPSCSCPPGSSRSSPSPGSRGHAAPSRPGRCGRCSPLGRWPRRRPSVGVRSGSTSVPPARSSC
jgi:hypothetical protein